MRKLLSCLAALFTILFGSNSSHANSSVKIMAAPFESRGTQRKSHQKSQHYLTVALPAAIAEKLEKSALFTMANGRIPILLPEQARLTREDGIVDLDSAARLAREKGATHFITGHYSGFEWDWSVTVEVYSVSGDSPALVGSGTAHGDQTVEFITPKGRKARIVGSKQIYDIFAEAVSKAFADAKMPISDKEKTELATPPSRDSYANILLNRAYIKYLNPRDDEQKEKNDSDKSPLAIVEHAVRVDPSSSAAQRFYAFLLEEDQKPKKARLHYEAALKTDPADARSLFGLGGIEMSEKNYAVAEANFRKAIKLSPDDARVYFNLGLARLALGETDKAIATMEVARDLEPAAMDVRRRLAELYAEKKDYRAAASEFRIIAASLPADKDAAFLLGACLRADGNDEGAALAYAEAAKRFPDDNRFLKFRGDVLLKKGGAEQAYASYRQALAVNPHDKRLLSTGMTADSETGISANYIGGEKLVDVVLDASVDVGLAENIRSKYQEAANDAVINFITAKRGACVNSGISSYLLAQKLGDQYADFGESINKASDAIISAREQGEWAYLTPDEASVAGEILDGQKHCHRDWMEIVSQNRWTLIPLLRRNNCDDLSKFKAADYDEIASRNLNRVVELPEVKPPQYMMAISPRIPPVSSRTVRCTADNTAGQRDYFLTIDGQAIGTVPAGEKRDFTANVGRHRMCLLTKNEICKQENERDVFIYEKWTITVKP